MSQFNRHGSHNCILSWIEGVQSGGVWLKFSSCHIGRYMGVSQGVFGY
jgi:hypothetical protein